MRIEAIFQRATRACPRVALVGADDIAALEGLASFAAPSAPLLFGPLPQMRIMAEQANLVVPESSFIATDSPAEAAAMAASAVGEGRAQVLMKGHVDSPTFLKAILNPKAKLRQGHLLTHLALVHFPDREELIFLTDSGVVIQPNLEQKAAILNNALEALRSLGIACPKVAFLSAAEKAMPSMPCSEEAAWLAQGCAAGEFGAVEGCGPIDFGIAWDPEAARIKGIDCPNSGRFDLWMVPNLVAGNLLGKSFIYAAGAAVGGVVLGAKAPIILLSRASTAKEKELSISLAMALAPCEH